MNFLGGHLIAGRLGKAREIERIALLIVVFHDGYVAASFQANSELGGAVLEIVRGEGDPVFMCRFNGTKSIEMVSKRFIGKRVKHRVLQQ